MRTRSLFSLALLGTVLVGGLWCSMSPGGEAIGVGGRALRSPGEGRRAELIDPARPGAADRSPIAPATVIQDEGADAAPTVAPVPEEFLFGRVVDGSGQALEGVLIERWPDWSSSTNGFDSDWGGRAAAPQATRTEEEGRFRMAVPARSLSILRASAQGFAPAERWGCAAGGEVLFELTAEARLSGVILRADDDSPVADALVRVFHGPDQQTRSVTRSDALGQFELRDLMPGEAGLQVVPAQLVMPRWRELMLEPGTPQRVEVRLEVGWTLAGRVTAARGGAPIAGAEVSGWEFLGKTVRTDEGGFYSIGGCRETIGSLVARAPGFGRMSIAYSGPGATYDFALESGRHLTGRVVDGEGRALSTARVSAVGFGSIGPVGQREWSSVTVNGAGRFSLEDLRCDLELALLVRCPGWASGLFAVPMAEASADASSADVLDLGDLVLLRGARVAGSVLDADGSPLAHVSITLKGPIETACPPGAEPFLKERCATSDSEGRFALWDLAPGTWEVLLRAEGGRIQEESLVLAEGEQRGHQTWRLGSGGSLEGVVREGAGPGVGEAFVTLYPEDGHNGPRLTTRCDAAGLFAFRDVPAGLFVLHASGPEEEPGGDIADGQAPLLPALLRNLRPDGRFVEVVLKRGTAWIDGRVLEADGAPVPLALVVRDRGDGRRHDGVLTDAAGRFRVRVAPGSRTTLFTWRTRPLGEALGNLSVLEWRLKRHIVDTDHPPPSLADQEAGASGVTLRFATRDR